MAKTTLDRVSVSRVATQTVRYRERLWVPWWWWPIGIGLSTVMAGLTLPLWALATGQGEAGLVFAGGVAVFVAWTHRANLARLRAGTEHRFERARVLARAWSQFTGGGGRA